MNLNEIKNKLSSLNNKGKNQPKEKKDYTLIYWKPKTEGKYQIRFVPSKINQDNPFQEIQMHYGIGKFPIVALTNWGEKDPIVEFVKALRSSSDSNNWEIAKKITPKLRIFAPVIVRGEEDKGVRLFEFSKSLYMDLLSIADDEDFGDFTDIKNGFDFTLKANKIDGRPGFDLSVTPKPKQTPLSTDSKLVSEWLENQPELLEERYKYTYDKLKEELQNYLAGGDEDEEPIETKSPTPIAPPKSTLQPRTTPKDKFDATFEDEDEEYEDNDLPF